MTSEYKCECDDKCDTPSCECSIYHVQKYECNTNCKCSENCSNRVVQKGITKYLKVEYISIKKGFGVFTLEKIKKGIFVCEYTGEIINKDKAKDKINSNISKKKPNYVLQIRENYEKMIVNTFIDAEYFGNVSRFLNHSCDPNLYFEIIRIEHFVPHVAFFALRDIEEGEELTFSYCDINNSMDNFQLSHKKCECKAEKCIKYLPS